MSVQDSKTSERRDEKMLNPATMEAEIILEEASQTQNRANEIVHDVNTEEPTGNLQVIAVGTETFLTGKTNEIAEETFEPCCPDQAVKKKTTFSTDFVSTTATVRIMLLPNGDVMTMAFAIGLTTRELKENFASELKIPSGIIQIALNGRVIEDFETLIDLGVQPHGTIQLEMSSVDPGNYPIRPVKPQTEYNMPDVITVRVQTDSDTYQDMVVEIERTTQRKAFLGGYRHKVTGTEFHHVAVQTMARSKPDKGVGTFCRDTQTVEVKSQSQQCTNSMSTQMTKIGCYISNMGDRLISPGEYITADEYHSKRLKAAIVLQTYTRRWQAQRFTEHLRQGKERRLAWMRKEETRRKEEKEEQTKAEYQRRMNPETREDFALLYSALEKWRQEETEHIDSTLSGPERKAALCALLEQETKLIASIGQHRIMAEEKNHLKGVQAFLDKCAAPKRWRAFDGKMTQMETQYTLRAKELRQLFSCINMQYLNPDERLDVLLTLKHTVKEQDCKLTQDIVELIDREADLLMRGIKAANLEGLRKRISTLFLQYIKTPAFNPVVSKLLKVPQDPAQLKNNVYFCRGCHKYLLSTHFALAANARVVRTCRRCTQLDNEARRREDLSLYKNILKLLRQTEAGYNQEAKIVYLLQEQDLRYLIDEVWKAQSALTAWDDLHDLVMVRWDRLWEWSPWNCVLLTKEEAAAHLRVKSVEQEYGSVFIQSIKRRHTLAKRYFSKIPLMTEWLHKLDSQPAVCSDPLVTGPVATQSKPSSPQAQRLVRE